MSRHCWRPVVAGLSASTSPRPPGLEALPWIASAGASRGGSLGTLMGQSEATLDALDTVLPAIFDHAAATYGPLVVFEDLPPLGGPVVMITDPRHFMACVWAEGRYPSGGFEGEVGLRQYHTDRALPTAGFFGRGKAWRHYRNAIAPDLLAPVAVRAYLPGIGAAAANASRAVQAHQHDLPRFLRRLSYDMFHSVAFGAHSESAALGSEEVDAFCRDAELVLAGNLLFSNPLELDAMKAGQHTPRRRRFDAAYTRLHEHCGRVLDHCLARMDDSEGLDEDYYLARVRRRQDSSCPSTRLSTAELKHLLTIQLMASVDASAIIGWTLIQLATHPKAQARLARELESSGVAPGWNPKQDLLYLQACVRESHRLTPSLPTSMAKTLEGDVDLPGVRIPAGTQVILNASTVQKDEHLVTQPSAYRPERWLPDAVRARAGSVAEVLDHPLLATPFGAGVRSCPGARVMKVNVLSAVARLCQDWHWELQGPDLRDAASLGARFQGVVSPDRWPEFRVRRRL